MVFTFSNEVTLKGHVTDGGKIVFISLISSKTSNLHGRPVPEWLSHLEIVVIGPHAMHRLLLTAQGYSALLQSL